MNQFYNRGFFSYFGSESLLRPVIISVQDVNPVLNYFYGNEVAKAAGLSRTSNIMWHKNSQHIKTVLGEDSGKYY